MSPSELTSSLAPLFPGLDAVTQTVALGGICAALLTPAEKLAPAMRQPLFWRKELLLDLAYWFCTPLLTRALTGAAIALLLLAAAFLIGPDRIPQDFILHGFGPLSRQPVWLQCLEVLLLSDFIDYWTHRTLHVGFHRRFWKIHAIHHSPEHMNWISSSRVHPLNDLITRSFQVVPIIALGFSALAVVSVVPLVSFYVMFLHSNIKWGFGPLRWVLVSPAYHRWHHTTDDEGLDKNYAGIFPIWDLLFGTAHFPRNALPVRYGLKTEHLPESFLAQMLYPFTSKPKESPERKLGK
jgi:sterol desaturase/sphingolipid hydroxylase (fatty acid hydroxylase superfamily)